MGSPLLLLISVLVESDAGVDVGVLSLHLCLVFSHWVFKAILIFWVVEDHGLVVCLSIYHVVSIGEVVL